MSQQKYPKAYEAYQQAVYRDGRNPTFWCSIGVLYYQINQYRDALDAYSRAIRLNPYISEVWYDLGTLVSRSYPQCNDVWKLTSISTNPATTRPMMLLMPTNGRRSWIPPTSTSRTGWRFFVVDRVPGFSTRLRRRLLRMCTPTLTNRESTDHQALSGARKAHSLHKRPLPHLLRLGARQIRCRRFRRARLVRTGRMSLARYRRKDT